MNPQKPEASGADAKPPKTSNADMQSEDAGTADSGADDSATSAVGAMKPTDKSSAGQERPGGRDPEVSK